MKEMKNEGIFVASKKLSTASTIGQQTQLPSKFPAMIVREL